MAKQSQKSREQAMTSNANELLALPMVQRPHAMDADDLMHERVPQMQEMLYPYPNESQIQFGRPNYATNIEMWLQFQFENAYGARIYLDYLGRHVVYIQSHPTPLNYMP